MIQSDRAGPLRQRRKPGSIVQIDLEDGTYAFGLVLETKVAFYDYLLTEKELPCNIDTLKKQRFAFIVCVMDNCITNFWPVIGKIKYDKSIEDAEDQWTYDASNQKYTIWKTNAGGQVPATWEQCKDLEYLSAWGCGSVEQRLRDHFAGRPCWFLENKKPDWVYMPMKEFYAQYGYDFNFLDDDPEET